MENKQHFRTTNLLLVELIKSMIKAQKYRKYIVYCLILFLITVFIVVIYYINYPYPEQNVDTVTYLGAVKQLQTTGNPVHPTRLPTYPLLIMIVYLFAGQGNLMAVSIVQIILFVLATLEFYILAALIFKRTWLAFLLGLFVGTNLILLSYSKPIMSEGISLWLLTTIILLTVVFMRTFNRRVFWLLFFFVILLCFTRPEWIFLPLLLYSYLFFIVLPRDNRRAFLYRILVSAGVIYSLLGGYVLVNGFASGFFGLTTIENMNALGKVLQYRMHLEAPPEYQEIGLRLDRYVRKGQLSPYVILGTEPDLARNNAKLAGDFARAIIIRHPFEFIGKTIPTFFFSLTTYHTSDRIPNIVGPYDQQLSWLFAVHRVLYACNALFPYCALFWLVLLIWKRTRTLAMVRMLAFVALVALLATVITTTGGYFDHDYMRVHIVFDPLIILTIWGTLGIGTGYLSIMLVKRWRQR